MLGIGSIVVVGERNQVIDSVSIKKERKLIVLLHMKLQAIISNYSQEPDRECRPSMRHELIWPNSAITPIELSEEINK